MKMLPALALVAAASNKLYTLDYGRLSPAEQVFAQTLQGLVGKDRPRIWMDVDGVAKPVLRQIRSSGIPVRDGKNIWALAARFRSRIHSVIEYKLGTHSLNVANSLCGPMQGVAVDEAMAAKAAAHGLRVTLDVRSLDEATAYDRYRKLWKKGIVIEQTIEKPGQLRDFAVKHDAFVFDTRDSAFRKRVIREAGPNTLVFGWGPEEYQWITDVSSAQGIGIAADWCINLSALESFKASSIKRPLSRPVKGEQGLRYIAFVLTDGDNLQWQTTGFATDRKFYASPERGKFPFTWELSPFLAVYAPLVLQYIYDRAAPSDDFICGAGLPGYVYPNVIPDRESMAKFSRSFVRASDLRIGSFINQDKGSISEVFPWLEGNDLDAAAYKTYSRYDLAHGQLAWTDGKPVLAYRFVLYQGMTEIDELLKGIAAMPTGLDDAASYALINVHAWSYGKIGGPLEAVKQVMTHLPPNTRVVTATQLFELLKANHPREKN